MELATKQIRTTKAELVALIKGQYAGDPDVLLDRVAQTLLSDASDAVRARAARDARLFVSEAVREAVAASLARMLLDDDGTVSSLAHTLPVSRLSPAEVLSRTGMSKSTLYRGDHVNFFSVIPAGMRNGRAYPAWQFVGDVPLQLPKVLAVLNKKSRIQVNTFLVSEQDALNELSPAEVLAGLPFANRGDVLPAQVRTLGLPEKARMDKVMALAALEVADAD